MNRSPEEEDPTHLKHVIFVDQGKSIIIVVNGLNLFDAVIG
jgi:hypothetical protein